MPNDCYNRLILRSTDNTKIEEAIAAFKAGKLLNYFVPQPADLDRTSIVDFIQLPIGNEPARIVATPEQLAKAHDPDWLKWRVEHWGTKWDIYDQGSYRRTKTAVEFDFCTAWNPPFKVYEAVIEHHGFELELTWDEPCMVNSGYWFPKYNFRLTYEYSDYDGLPDHLCERIRQIWIGLGRDEEIIAGEKIDATRTWGDFAGSDEENKDLFSV